MLDPEVCACPAVVARGPTAVLETLLPYRVQVVLPQEVPVQARRDVVPGERLVAARGRGARRRRRSVRARSSPSCHSRRSKCSDHSWKVPPDLHTCSMTAPVLRSPRLTMPSAVVAAGSCHRSDSPLILRAASFSRFTLRRSSASVSWPNHWNGVWAFGTKPPTEAVTVTDCWYRLPISTQVPPYGRCRGRRRRSRSEGR